MLLTKRGTWIAGLAYFGALLCVAYLMSEQAILTSLDRGTTDNMVVEATSAEVAEAGAPEQSPLAPTGAPPGYWMSSRGPRRYLHKLEPESKYMVFLNTGGFNNQRIKMTRALQIGKQLDRTIVIPMVTSHQKRQRNSKGELDEIWRSTFKLRDMSALIEPDHVFDLPWMEELGYRVEALNMSFWDFYHDVLMRDYPDQDRDWRLEDRSGNGYSQRWTEKRLLGWRPSVPILYFYKGSLWCTSGSKAKYGCGWSYDAGLLPPGDAVLAPEDREEGWKAVRFSPTWRNLATAIARDHMGGVYNAVHMRMSDQMKRYKRNPGVMMRDDIAKRGFLDRTERLYVTTEPNPKPTRLQPLANAGYSVSLSADLPKGLLDERLRAAFSLPASATCLNSCAPACPPFVFIL